MTNILTFAPQCAYALVELALSFLDTGDKAAAHLVVSEGLAFCGADSPAVLRDLEAVLRLNARFGPGQDLLLLRHRIAFTITPDPASLPEIAVEHSFVH